MWCNVIEELLTYCALSSRLVHEPSFFCVYSFSALRAMLSLIVSQIRLNSMTHRIVPLCFIATVWTPSISESPMENIFPSLCFSHKRSFMDELTQFRNQEILVVTGVICPVSLGRDYGIIINNLERANEFDACRRC